MRAASRELGVDLRDAQRAMKVAALSPEAKAAAVEHGFADNRTVLLTAKAAGPDNEAAHIIAERERFA